MRLCKNKHLIDYLTRCKICQRLANKRQRAKNPLSFSLRARKSKLKTKYNLTIEQYNQILIQQKYRCSICSKHQGDVYLAIDHCHKTGIIRGLLCRKCNLALGHLDDNETTLYNALLYLRYYQGIREPVILPLQKKG